MFIARILKIIAFFFTLVLFDQSCGYILRSLYFRQNTGPNQALTYTFSQCNSDILVFGNSRAQHHYNSKILSDSLNMSCFNAGQDGGHSIILQCALIKVITKRYSPKIIILEFNPDDIVHYKGDYDRLSVLLPYYEIYSDIRSLILIRSPYEKLKLMSSIYPFNSTIINSIRFNTNTHAARKQDIDGFVPTIGEMNTNMLKQYPDIEPQQTLVDINMVNALKDIIRLCNGKKISLIIINSPTFHTLKEKSKETSFATKLSLEIINTNRIKFIDLSFDSTFLGKHMLFRDKIHLNNLGANIFSNLIIKQIKNERSISLSMKNRVY